MAMNILAQKSEPLDSLVIYISSVKGLMSSIITLKLGTSLYKYIYILK
jgi:hypothetical protein